MGKKKKQEENIILPGQITIFDLLEIQKTEKRTIKCDSVTEKAENVTEIANSCTKSVKSYTFEMKKLTEEQQKILDQYKGDERVIRKILHACGRVSIEVYEDEIIKTFHYDDEGKNIFTVDNQIPVLPKDKIMYYFPHLNNALNEIQKKKLEEVKNKYQVNRVIHRNGEFNLLVEHEGGIISINPNGWVLEFENIKKIECIEDEVLEIIGDEVKEINIDEIEVGDTVEVMFRGNKITAKVTWIYNNADTYNISFYKKHTAVHKSCIVRVVT